MVDYGSHSGHTSAGCPPSRGHLECTARIEGVSHRSSKVTVSDKPRPDSPYLFFCLSAGATLLRISCVCLWPKAVVHGYILVVMCIKEGELMKAERDFEKILREPATIWGQGCESTLQSYTPGLLRSVQPVCAASDGQGLAKSSSIGSSWAGSCFESLYCLKIS